MSELAKMDHAPAAAPEVIDNRPAPADPYISMIERLVKDPEADLDKLERMLAMKKEVDADNQRRAYAESMATAQAEMKPVARNRENKQTNSSYADLSAIYVACKPIAGKHGLSFSTYPEQSEQPDKYLRVRWVVRHRLGYEETGTSDLPLDFAGIAGKVNKTGIHAFGSTSSYARRYLFCMIFDIATDDDDGNAAASGEPVTEKQFIELRDMIDKIPDLDESVVLAAENLTILEELPGDRYGAVMNNLRITAKKRGVQV